jgi:flagellar basal body-associated protein FliL
LVGEEGAVMNVLILILIVLLLIGVSGICYAVYVHFLIKNSDDWMDNSEYDYGHDVRYEEDDEQF